MTLPYGVKHFKGVLHGSISPQDKCWLMSNQKETGANAQQVERLGWKCWP